MEKFLKIILIIIFFVSALLVFKNWIFPQVITGGDFWPYLQSMYGIRTFPLLAWDFSGGNGLGGFSGPFLWIHLNLTWPLVLGNILHLPWWIVERIGWFFPFIIICALSPYLLFKYLFDNKIFAILTSFIYLLNTYILMVVGGGQVAGIALAYSIIPLIFLFLFKSLDSKENNLVNPILCGLILSLQIIWDMRISYITIISCGVLFLFYVFQKKISLSKLGLIILIPLLAFIINSFWLIPTLFVHQNPFQNLGSEYSSVEIVKFLSFAKFENALGLLHPNWPENLFGKSYFMRPEFIVLPILAFSSLLFIGKEKIREKIIVLFFVSLSLLGIFLAKGANDPFGGVYTWMFSHVPGFILFRDSSKWYSIIAFSYTILISFTIMQVYNLSSVKFPRFHRYQIKGQHLKIAQSIFVVLVSLLLAFLILPALKGNLSGLFLKTQVPKEYLEFENFLQNDKDFSRVLWYPTQQRFGYYSSLHPAVPAQSFFIKPEIRDLERSFKNERTERQLQDASVKYVVVPFDSQGEIFLKDRKYNEGEYKKAVESAEAATWLTLVKNFGKIKVYAVPDAKDHFWCDCDASISYQAISPIKYLVDVKNAREGDKLIFSETYDSNWIAKNENWSKTSAPFEKKYNSFDLTKGDSSFEIYYSAQKYVYIGQLASLIVFILTIIVLSVLLVNKARK